MRWVFYTHSLEGKRNEKTAMQTTAVYACVKIIDETIVPLPLHTYRYTETGKEKASDHQIYHLLADEPNSEMTSFVFRETLRGHLLLWANTYAKIVRYGRGNVMALYPLMLQLFYGSIPGSLCINKCSTMACIP